MLVITMSMITMLIMKRTTIIMIITSIIITMLRLMMFVMTMMMFKMILTRERARESERERARERARERERESETETERDRERDRQTDRQREESVNDNKTYSISQLFHFHHRFIQHFFDWIVYLIDLFRGHRRDILLLSWSTRVLASSSSQRFAGGWMDCPSRRERQCGQRIRSELRVNGS